MNIKHFAPTPAGLFLLAIICFCTACEEPAEDEQPNDLNLPFTELYFGETQEGVIEKADVPQWYYFNAAVNSSYELICQDMGAGTGLTARISISAYQADKSTPYFENQEAGSHIFTTLRCERVYIKVEKADREGSFSLTCRLRNSSPPLTWTLMIYMNAGLYLEDYSLRNVSQLINGYHPDCGINVLLLLDKETNNSYFNVPYCKFSDTRLFVINADGLQRVSGGREMVNITEDSVYEANVGDANTVKRFIEYGKRNYPARYYGLIIKSHGSGSKGCCDDESAGGDRLHLGELSDVLDESHSLDLLGFNTCYMGSAEVAYQFRTRTAGEPGEFEAGIMLASASMTDPLGWQYDKILGRISTLEGSNGEHESLTGGIESIYSPSELTPLELGRIITEEERDGMYAISPETGDMGMLTCYDLSKAAAVKKSVDGLAVSLAENNEQELLEELRDNLALVLRYYMIYPPGTDSDKAQRKASPFYDMVSLCEAVEADSRFTPASRTAAGAVLAALDELIIYSYSGPDTSNRYGLSIFFTNGDELYLNQPMYSYHWWYNALDVTERGAATAEKYYGKLAWCADKATDTIHYADNWFEMLDAWYDESNDESGGFNGYRY